MIGPTHPGTGRRRLRDPVTVGDLRGNDVRHGVTTVAYAVTV